MQVQLPRSETGHSWNSLDPGLDFGFLLHSTSSMTSMDGGNAGNAGSICSAMESCAGMTCQKTMFIDRSQVEKEGITAVAGGNLLFAVLRIFRNSRICPGRKRMGFILIEVSYFPASFLSPP